MDTETIERLIDEIDGVDWVVDNLHHGDCQEWQGKCDWKCRRRDLVARIREALANSIPERN